MNIENCLFVIPARGGSKGLPRKNILPLCGKQLICYSIDVARALTGDENICVSTDDAEIIDVVEKYGLKVPFTRPAELATDTASSQEVIIHAINYYKRELNRNYETICLLQPTSPLRKAEHVKEAFKLWDNNLDMVVSVKESKSNPYFNLFEEQADGFLKKSKEGNYTRRQDAPRIWEYNGAIYIINIQSIKLKNISQFSKVRKFIMENKYSVDIDTIDDLKKAEREL
jgi:N-acylneuraminate cytidylyltransferase